MSTMGQGTKLTEIAGYDLLPAQSPSDIAVIVTTYNHAHYLGDALGSIAAQTLAPATVIVVDDGSTDDPLAVVEQFPGVRLIRTENRGLAAARNTGLGLVDSRLVLFLDADDVLEPEALALSLACMKSNPGSALVYGGYRITDENLRTRSTVAVRRTTGAPFRNLLEDNIIGMHGAVLYDRACLLECGGFDPELRRCEDYDVYLRIARAYPIACHNGVVAGYRMHGENMSRDVEGMLNAVLQIQERYRPDPQNRSAFKAWSSGVDRWRRAYADSAWRWRPSASRTGPWKHRMHMLRQRPVIATRAALRQLVVALLPSRLMDRVRDYRRRHSGRPRGSVDMGDLARIRPVSYGFGFKRGIPVDRYYVDGFVGRCAEDIRGRVLEIGDDEYCRRFGSGVTRQDILHIDPAAPRATIVGDISQSGVLPPDAFDCLVVLQTLHLIYDMRGAVQQMRKALRRGGTALVTVPGISPIDTEVWGDTWYWSLTRVSAMRMFEEAFGKGNVEVETFGNAFAATCFIQGMALEDVDPRWLDQTDPAFQVVIAVRARAR